MGDGIAHAGNVRSNHGQFRSLRIAMDSINPMDRTVHFFSVADNVSRAVQEHHRGSFDVICQARVAQRVGYFRERLC